MEPKEFERAVAEATREIRRRCSPTSIFLYRSSARSDQAPSSDIEIGVVFEDESFLGRSTLDSLGPTARAYPYRLGALRGDRPIETPFQREVFLRDLATSARTIFGQQIVEHIIPPPITVLSATEELRFNIGRALAALLSFRSGDMPTAIDGFSKSCLLGTRVLAMVDNGVFPATYSAIGAESRELDLGRFDEVVHHALELRHAVVPLDRGLVYDNLDYLSAWIDGRLRLRTGPDATPVLVP